MDDIKTSITKLSQAIKDTPNSIAKHTVDRRKTMSCKAAVLDPEEGRYYCAVSGDQCMYYIPNSKRCVEEYGEGPDAGNDEE